MDCMINISSSELSEILNIDILKYNKFTITINPAIIINIIT